MDYRRGYSQGSTVTAAVLQHGDVYKITTNASNYPLPKYEFLRIRYAAQCITAGMQTAGALSDIFCGPPPDVKGIKDAARKREMVPEEWDVLIEFAQREGVLSEEAAERWRLSIVEQYYIWTPPSSPMSSSNEEYT
ncbi:hypothetical protein QBC35DRAFT_448859 [Podospora australis]|uniref:Uncharacterized protein n=1 Tax=Podospora australis TaxID=1536484 RepID=A0AAN6WZN4_9PEZI|nr:hypothetical protein QBC35DRAFT_448859 [Podospora australis]